MLEWYIPWSAIDWVLKIQFLAWLAAIATSWWIAWRVLIRKRPWLERRERK